MPGLSRSIVYQFCFHNFLCLCLASVHLPHPFHLVFGFQLLGHADGGRDLLAVAMREVTEETGLQRLTPVTEGIFSLECLTVDGHEKRGEYVPSHIHMNVTYLLAAEDDALREKPDENSGVAWFTPEEALAASTEPWMVQRVYRKLADRAAAYMKT